MNLSALQSELRHFAAERDWQPFHTPKNLSTALLVEAAELAEVFQWMTPEQSQAARLDPETKGRIVDEVADVLLYLLQVADHCQVDVAQAVGQKLARNARKYPPVRSVAREMATNASSAANAAHPAVPGVHVLVDYENVQPTEEALRALVPDASQIWVFHGPHQREVARHFAGFGDAVTAVPISKTGKDALDFHLSFYVGYLASRNPLASLVVVANDKGYEPMLTHARALGFAARQVGHVSPRQPAAAKKGAARKVVARKVVANEAPAKKVAAKKVAAKEVATPKAAATPQAPVTRPAPARKTSPAKETAAAKKATPKKATPKKAATPQAAVPAPAATTGKPSRAGPATHKRLVDALRKMGDQRPTKPKSLLRVLKSLLGAEATDDLVEQALGRLVSEGVVQVSAARGVSYPRFADARSE